MSEFEGWVNTTEAAELTGYAPATIRYLARKGRVKARKISLSRSWFVERESLMDYKRRMDRLGPDKHNPWRDDLQEGRGRRDTENGG
jgi:hypothetical protein